MNVLFLGGTRYDRPLDATDEKKFRALAEIADCTVVAFSTTARPRRFRQHARFWLLPRPRVAALRYAGFFLLAPVLALRAVLRHDARVIVAQSPYHGWVGAWVKRASARLGRRVALVVESHGDFDAGVFLYRDVLAPTLYRRIMRRAAKRSLEAADALRAISRATAAQLEAWAPDTPLVRFPTWTDIDAFFDAGDRRPVRPEPVVLYAGTLNEGKGVHDLVAAFARLSGRFPVARLVIAGRRENAAYAMRLEEQVARAGLSGKVEFAGELPQAALAERMRRAAVFALPSRSEGLGRVVLEAMAAGLPVIGCAVGGIPEMIAPGETGLLVEPRDAAALADRLRWVLDHPEEARRMGRRARAFAESFFSTGSYVDGYRELFAAAAAAAAFDGDGGRAEP